MKTMKINEFTTWSSKWLSLKINQYSEKIGVDMMNSSNSVLTDVTIYCEPWTAYTNTKRAIEMALAERKHHNENKN